MSEENNEDKFDVFDEANFKFLSELNEKDELGQTNIEKANYTQELAAKEKSKGLLEEAKRMTYSSRTNAWDRLKEDLEGGHAERFNNILKTLPDKEFARLYLKSLEFVKPKLIREKRSKGENEVDNVINVRIRKSDRTIDITNVEDIDHEELN